MNKWTKATLELVKGNYYLDNLMSVYSPEELSRENIDVAEIRKLRELHKLKKCNELILELINLTEHNFKFPIDHPYVGFLMYYKEAINKNPKAVKQICNILLRMNFNEIKQRLEAPKAPSRRIGPMFKSWLMKNFQFMDAESFGASERLVFLKGSYTVLKGYAQEKLGCKFPELSKGLDMIAKSGNRYLIGTAKFITRTGGSQTNQFYEAMLLIKGTTSPSNVLKLAVIDGIAWLNRVMFEKLEALKENEFAISALLFEKFIEEML